jgi:hypothetical protein
MAIASAYSSPAPFFSGSLACGEQKTCGYGAEFDFADASHPIGQGLSVGDPCTQQTGCGASHHLVCKAVDGSAHLMTCARRDSSDVGCSSTNRGWNDCPVGSFCTTDGTCAQFSEEGAPCMCAAATQECGPGLVCFLPRSGTFPGATCYTVDNSTFLSGTCVRQNSLPPSSRIFIAPALTGSLQAYSRSSGVLLCESGLAVPVRDAWGYASNTSVCVSSWDWSTAGTACDNCTMNADGAYPLAGDGSLSCLPTAPGTGTAACTAVPSYAFTADALSAQVSYAQCTQSAKSPAGTPCANQFYSSAPLTVLNEGTCSYYACFGAYARMVSTMAVPNNLWANYFSTPCQVQNAQAAVSYSSNPIIGCSLPAALAAQGWSCQADTPPSGGGSKKGGLSRDETIAIAAVVVIVVVGAAIGVCICCVRRRCAASSATSGPKSWSQASPESLGDSLAPAMDSEVLYKPLPVSSSTSQRKVYNPFE